MRESKKNRKCKDCKRRYHNCHAGCPDYEQPTYNYDFSNRDIADYMRAKASRLKKLYR